MKKILLSIIVVAICSNISFAIEKKVTFRYASKADLHSLDPYALYEGMTMGFLLNIFDSLIRRDKNLNPAPGLASSWEIPSPTVWKFNLRKDAKFHDGTPFNADDVIFSYNRGNSESSDIKSMLGSIKEIKKIDDFTVEFHTKQPNPLLLDELYSMLIMSKSWCEKNNVVTVANVSKGEESFADLNANGTGPFKVIKRSPDVETILERNRGWWGAFEGNVDEVIFKPIGSDSTRIAGLLSGELDLITPLSLQDINRIEKSDKLEIMKKPGLVSVFLMMNMHDNELKTSKTKGKNPFKDINVRKAIEMAIDINAIKKKIMRNTSRPTGMLVGPGTRGYKEEIDERGKFDVDNAKKLMKEAGYESGFDVSMDCPNDRYMKDEMICQAVAAMLAKIGVKVNLNITNKSKYFGKVLSGDTDFNFMGWQPGTYDIHDAYYNLVATPKGGTQGKYNLGKYSNPKIDLLLEKIRFEMDQEKRQQHIDAMVKLHRADLPQIPLHQEPVIWAKKKNIYMVQRTDDFVTLHWVTIN
jgi:peptide/nickel transport system substrate-binding protein